VGDIDSFLRALPVAAKSPYALIAYITSALLFIASAYQRNQLRPVLRNLEKIPQRDRKSVIETTLNTKLPDRLSGEEFIRRERMKYVFLAFIGMLVLIGGVTTITLVVRKESSSDGNHGSRNTKIRVQLWPRPEIKQKFLKDHDARLYLKGEGAQLDLTTFVPTEDFLDETVDVEDDLIGKPVDLTISPRDKYSIEQDRRYLTRLVRLEVYPLGKRPVPPVTSQTTPSGEKVFRTTDLPFSSSVTIVNTNLFQNPHSDPTDILARMSYLLYVQGNNLSADTKLDIVDDKGQPVVGAWAGNELGTSNGKPVEVSADGTSLKTYFAVPSSATGRKLFWRIENPSTEISMKIPVKVIGSGDEKQF